MKHISKKLFLTLFTSINFIVLTFFVTINASFAQTHPVKISKNCNFFQYQVYDYGESIDTSLTNIQLGIHQNYRIFTPQKKGPFVPGYATENTIVSCAQDSVFNYYQFEGNDNDCYWVTTAFSRNDIEFDTAKVNGLTRYTCHINSNKMEFYVQDYPVDINPIPYYGRFGGLLVSFWRNGQVKMRLHQTSFVRENWESSDFLSKSGNLQRVNARQMSQIKKEKLVITHRIFDQVQLNWGKANDHINDNQITSIPYDSVLHYAGGTLALKKVKLPALPKHYQTFIELHQQSNGDAYDRTGSVFVIPQGYFGPTFFDGINQHPDSLPLFYDKNGGKYQGIAYKREEIGEWVVYYQPPVELMRFFTPFGVGHFNDRVKIDGLEWEDKTFYKQEVTDLSGYLQGDDVLIGVWIGNYDGGGHKVTLDIKSYPGDDIWTDDNSLGDDEICKSLFNTCNVLEMAGQNYGKLFGTDTLFVDFYLHNPENARLRFISTGHGGWEGGDEFNPKPNTILIDGKVEYIYTPWRQDCGCYREWNPVSGNFWNGMSSSDYSRSGWCPGTATQPVYFDLSHLPAGKHTLGIAIPQGESQAGSFSHWSVSGVLLGN
ncbi:MAG: glpgli family protein [Bacteroidales bacterium]|nr:glpgli family protein [Bacteroidales bacterium]